MIIIYLKKGGTAHIEKAKEPTETLLEMPDGNHPLTNDSYWQDAKRLRDSMVMVIQGVRGPYGATMEENDIALVLYDMKLREMALKPQNVSRMWWRALQRLGDWLVKYGYLLFIGSIMAWALYTSFLGG